MEICIELTNHCQPVWDNSIETKLVVSRWLSVGGTLGCGCIPIVALGGYIPCILAFHNPSSVYVPSICSIVDILLLANPMITHNSHPKYIATINRDITEFHWSS